jgi:hypothetical protein
VSLFGGRTLMVDPNFIFMTAFGLVLCYGVAMSYRQIREGRAEMSHSTYRNKVISLGLGAVAVLIWFGLSLLYLQYDETRPTIANESSGRIYAISNHGHVVFLTLKERCYLFLFGTIAVVSFLCGYILDRGTRKSLTESGADSGPR